jgi:hypothetical protein
VTRQRVQTSNSSRSSFACDVEKPSSRNATCFVNIERRDVPPPLVDELIAAAYHAIVDAGVRRNAPVIGCRNCGACMTNIFCAVCSNRRPGRSKFLCAPGQVF